MKLQREDNRRVAGDNPNGPNILIKKGSAFMQTAAIAKVRENDLFTPLIVGLVFDMTTLPPTPYIYRTLNGKAVTDNGTINSASIWKKLGKAGQELEMGDATLLTDDGKPYMVQIHEGAPEVQAVGFPLYIIGEERPKSLLTSAPVAAPAPLATPVGQRADTLINGMQSSDVSPTVAPVGATSPATSPVTGLSVLPDEEPAQQAVQKTPSTASAEEESAF